MGWRNRNGVEECQDWDGEGGIEDLGRVRIGARDPRAPLSPISPAARAGAQHGRC